jgi:diguanylate cyclase (GGDEF)-like protein
MIQRVNSIMDTSFIFVSLYDGMRKVQSLAQQNSITHFPVLDEDKLVGIVTFKHLLESHPNRIVADAMTYQFTSVSEQTPLWQAKEIIDENKDDVLLVMENNKVLGLVSRTTLLTELGKHTDLLTGLYKSEYIYYNCFNHSISNREFSIIFIDVNDFGQIDKKYGHAKGDAILQKLSQLLKNNIPDGAFLCRYGGDEFAILAPFVGKKCISFTEQLINSISSNVFIDNIDVSISAGIAEAKLDKDYNYDTFFIISSLINSASLASTKAKKENSGFAICSGLNFIESA